MDTEINYKSDIEDSKIKNPGDSGKEIGNEEIEVTPVHNV